MNQFSDRPFAIGSLFGIRSFQINRKGELTGVVHPEIWTADTNQAACVSPFRAFERIGHTATFSMAQMSWALGKMSADLNHKVLLTKRPKPPEPEPSHTIGSLGCTCGFYAYFDRGHNPHHKQSNILGIVEGFGVMTVGSRGFRCSKARIRALIVEDSDDGLASVLSPQYSGIPRFASIEDALAEFPLTVPDGTPEPVLGEVMTSPGYVSFTMTVDTSGLSRSFANLQAELDRHSTDEKERALRKRRERNTGPRDRRGLDGHFRRR